MFANTMTNQLHWILFRLNQLGFFLLLYQLLLSAVDFATPARRNRYLRFLYPARVFGMVSLTVFFCEPIVAEVLKKLWDLLAPGWNENLAAVLLFGIFCLLIWWFLLKFWWSTIRFAGSLEWMSSVVIRSLSGKKSTRASFSFMKE